MSGGLNKVMLIGRVGRPVELRYTPNGTSVATFSLAVNRRWMPAGQSVAQEAVEWMNIVAWEKLADVCNTLLDKGRLIYIEGRLQTRSWEAQDGQKRYRTEVVATTMLLLDNKPNEREPAYDDRVDEDPRDVEDIPF